MTGVSSRESGERSQAKGEKEPGPVTPDAAPPRVVSWHGGDVLFLFLLWFALVMLCVRGLISFSKTDTSDTSTTPAFSASTANEHPLSRLVTQSKNAPLILFVAFLSGVILAPLAEEFLLRLVLQGWLQKWMQEQLPGGRHFYGRGAIVFVSVIFASLHGGKHQEQSVDTLFYSILGLAVANFLTLCIGAALLGKKYSLKILVSWALQREHITEDVFLGAGTFFVVGPIIFALHAWLRAFFPTAATDPVPLFFFSLALGFLFFKTGRLLPCVVLHACLNGFSYALLVSQSLP